MSTIHPMFVTAALWVAPLAALNATDFNVAPGGALDRLVSFVDFGPTMSGLAGIKSPGPLQGVAFLGWPAGYGDLAGQSTRPAAGAQQESKGLLQVSHQRHDYRFAGEQFDSSLGLCYLRARYLNAGTGRFWTRDTHPGNNQEPLSLHRYLYVSADPVNRVDPSGLVEFNLGSFMAAMSKAAGLAANTAWRVAPLANRVTILLYESVSGTTIVGGAGLLVGGKFVMTTVGGGTKVLDPAVKGGLERVALAGFEEAGKYGVWPHRLLAKLVPPNSGLHKHHLVEVRFAKTLQVAEGDIPAIALTPAEHARFTAEWQRIIGLRGWNRELTTASANADNIWEAAKEVYADYPELLEFVQMFMGR